MLQRYIVQYLANNALFQRIALGIHRRMAAGEGGGGVRGFMALIYDRFLK
jgi:hypothetical protein